MEWAEYPARKCREAFTENGLTDHTCELIDGHPGPPAARSSAASVTRREAWETAHPGWQRMMADGDPFADFTGKITEEAPSDQSPAPLPVRPDDDAAEPAPKPARKPAQRRSRKPPGAGS